MVTVNRNMVTGNNFCIDYCNLSSNFVNYFVICFDSYHLICDNSIYYMSYFVIYYWNSVYSLGLNGNWMQKQFLLCLNSIVNSYFYIGYFVYLIDCIYFVSHFVNFVVRAIYLYNWSYMVIDFLNNLGYLEVVFLNYYYYIFFCLVGFDLFSYIDRMTYLVLCAFEVYSDCLVVFVYIRQYYVRIVGNNYTIF